MPTSTQMKQQRSTTTWRPGGPLYFMSCCTNTTLFEKLFTTLFLYNDFHQTTKSVRGHRRKGGGVPLSAYSRSTSAHVSATQGPSNIPISPSLTSVRSKVGLFLLQRLLSSPCQSFLCFVAVVFLGITALCLLYTPSPPTVCQIASAL